MYYIFSRHVSLKAFFIFLSEAALIFTTALGVASMRFALDSSEIMYQVHAYDPYFIKTTVITATYLAAYSYFELYTPYMYRPGRDMIIRLVKGTLAASVVLFTLYFIIPSAKTWRGILLANNIALPVVILAWRSVFSRIATLELPQKNVLIIGSGELAEKIGADIFRRPENGLKLIGFIDDDPAKLGVSIVNPGVIGCFGDINRVVEEENIDRIIIAMHDRRAKLPMSALLDCKLKGVTVEEGETFNERTEGKIPLNHLKPSWMVFSDGFKSLRTRKRFKRVEDVFLAVLCLIMAIPFFLVVPLLIKIDSRGPVFFKQKRVGENGRIFTIFKFRSMQHNAEAETGPVWISEKNTKITRVGKVIRKLRIDELPQLINVLKGDMSFVGPRPERPYFVGKLKEVIPYYEIRTVVKPGITGWAQINYPYCATFRDATEKLQYDIFYIKNMNPVLDLMIFFWTFKVVVTGRGAR